MSPNLKDCQDQSKVLTEDEKTQFISMFPHLLEEIMENPEYKDLTETNLWLTRVLQYNVPHGKLTRGLATVLAYRYLAKEITDEDVHLSHVLGWCLEILQGCCLVADDIMDESETRRGRPCWYKKDNLGVSAFNDALLMDSVVHYLLHKYFHDKEYYKEVSLTFHDVVHKTGYGQSLDTRTGSERNMHKYTMDLYSAIVKYKTSFYTFYLPVRLAMAMAGIKNPNVINQVKTITLEIGHLFQVQDDYLDCFGDTSVTGKIGTDIQDCKCSWLFVKAVEICTTEQKQILIENYGKNEPASIKRVKGLYEELCLPNVYKVYEETLYKSILGLIQKLPEELPNQLFIDMVNMIYKRCH